MSSPHEWFTVQMPYYFSAWLWRTFRRPRRFLLLVIVTPIILVLGFTHWVNVRRARTESLQHLRVTAHLASEILEETLEGTVHLGKVLLSDPSFRNAIQRRDQQAIQRHLQEALPYIPHVDLGMVIDSEGIVIASYPGEYSLTGQNVSKHQMFQGARNAWSPSISAVYVRSGSKEKVVGVIQGFSLGDKTRSYLLLEHRVEEIKSWLQKVRVEPGGFLYIVDHHGQLVVHPYQLLPGEPKVVRDWPTVLEPLGETGAVLRYRDPHKRKVWLAGIHPVGTLGWRVAAVQPERAALGSLFSVFWTLSLVSGSLLVLVMALSFRWAQLHTFSLRLLRQNAKLLKQAQQRNLLERSRRGLSRPGGK